MTAKEILSKINSGEEINVIDIRAKDRYDRFHLPNAIWIAKEDILGKDKTKLDKNKKYYLTCNSGNSASVITHVLKAEGYDVEFIENGMNPLADQEKEL